MLVDLDHDPPARRVRIPALGIVRVHLKKLPDRSLGSPAILQRHRLADDDVTLLFPKRSVFRTQHRHGSFLQRVILAWPVDPPAAAPAADPGRVARHPAAGCIMLFLPDFASGRPSVVSTRSWRLRAGEP